MSSAALHLLQVVSEPDGAAATEQALQLARGLEQRGDRCTVACQPGSGVQQRARELGLATLPLLMRHGADWTAARTLRAFVERHGVDLLHAHGDLAHGVMALAARGAGVPRVVTRHGTRRLRRGLERLAYQRGADLVLTTSAAAHRALRASGLPAGRLAQVAAGVPVPEHVGLNGHDPLALRARLGLVDGGPVVATLSAFDEDHGLDRLVEALPALSARHPGLQLLVLGDGEARARVGARVSRAGLTGRVHLPGALGDVAHVLPLADAYCEPAGGPGHPDGLATALAVGLPSVGTACCEAADLLRPERTGLVVPAGDGPALARALASLLDHPGWARRLGAAGRRLVRERHSLPAMVQDVRRLYLRLLPRRAGAG